MRPFHRQPTVRRNSHRLGGPSSHLRCRIASPLFGVSFVGGWIGRLKMNSGPCVSGKFHTSRLKRNSITMKQLQSSTPKSRPLSPGEDGPWMWQCKMGVRLIRASLDGINAVSSGLLVYFALTELASNQQAATFVTTRLKIGELTGLSVRTVQLRLNDLKELGLLISSTPQLKRASTYTILSVMGNHCTTMCNQRNHASLHSSEEALKHQEQSLEDRASQAKPDSFEELDAFAQETGRDDPEFVSRFWDWNESRDWFGVMDWHLSFVGFYDKLERDRVGG